MRLRRETGDFTLDLSKNPLSITIAKNLKPIDFLGAILDFGTAGEAELNCCVIVWAHYQDNEETINRDLIILEGANVSPHLAEYVPSTGVVTILD